MRPVAGAVALTRPPAPATRHGRRGSRRRAVMGPGARRKLRSAWVGQGAARLSGIPRGIKAAELHVTLEGSGRAGPPSPGDWEPNPGPAAAWTRIRVQAPATPAAPSPPPA